MFNEDQPRDEIGRWTSGGTSVADAKIPFSGGDIGAAIRSAASDKKYINPTDGSSKKFDYGNQKNRYTLLTINVRVGSGAMHFAVDDGSGNMFTMERGKITRPNPTQLKFTLGGKDHILDDNWDKEIKPFVEKNKIILP